jgi:hypothetical protein
MPGTIPAPNSCSLQKKRKKQVDKCGTSKKVSYTYSGNEGKNLLVLQTLSNLL